MKKRLREIEHGLLNLGAIICITALVIYGVWGVFLLLQPHPQVEIQTERKENDAE